jgi:hypothetical protein
MAGAKIPQQSDDLAPFNAHERLLPPSTLQSLGLVLPRLMETLLHLHCFHRGELIGKRSQALRVLPLVQQVAQSLDACDAPEESGKARRAVLVPLSFYQSPLFEVLMPQHIPRGALLRGECD